MLILERRRHERITIGTGPDRVVLEVVRIQPGKVRIGIHAPKTVRIDREEVHRARSESASPHEQGATMNEYDLARHRGMTADELLGRLITEWRGHRTETSPKLRDQAEKWFCKVAAVAEERGLGHLVTMAKQEVDAWAPTK